MKAKIGAMIVVAVIEDRATGAALVAVVRAASLIARAEKTEGLSAPALTIGDHRAGRIGMAKIDMLDRVRPLRKSRCHQLP
ncbi:MAG TPA: hypothetical protein VH170_05525 [Chthoniobacterales bacterium]|jgi:hypothetical protein|nr:hypothetical protein [Chthoniobacterales bacterium]